MATLQEMLLAPDTQPRVVADCEELVTNQVAELSGVTGAAISSRTTPCAGSTPTTSTG